MSPEAQRIAIAEACGRSDRWVLIKRGLYWRPNAHGYTSNLSEAWILTEAEADEYVYPHDEPVTKERAPLPDYLNDLNAMHEAENTLTEETRWKYVLMIGRIEPVTFKAVCATASQRAEAFLRTLNKWDDSK